MTVADDIRGVVNHIVTVLLVLSIIGSFLTLVTFLIFRDIRTYPIKLILYLCICIIIGFTAFLISFEPWIYNTWACIPTAVAIHYFFLANFCWTFCIAFNFYQMIVRRNRESQLLEKWYHLFSWVFPALMCIATGASLAYGNLTSVCYIASALLRFLCFFLPGLIIISSNAVLFFFIGREIHETLAGAPKSDQRDRKKEFRVYISIFISIGLSWVFGYMMFLIPHPIPALIFYILFALTTPCQGVLIFLSYCINKKVAAKWAGLFGRCLPFCKTWETQLVSTTNSSSRSNSSRSSNSSRGSSSASSASSSSSSSSSSMI